MRVLHRGRTAYRPGGGVTEAEFQAHVLELAGMYGWRVAHFHDSRRQVRPGVHVGDRRAAGFPDLVLVRDRVVYAELKRQNGRATPAQRSWLAALEQAGQETYLWRPDNMDEIVRVLAGRADARRAA